MTLFSDLPQPEALEAAIRMVFSERVATEATPATAFVVFDRSGIALEGGIGQAWPRGGIPTPETRFRIASCSKSFAAAAILMLRDQGLLTLDDTTTRYVPALRPTLPATLPQAPTLRMLLSMSGGLPTDDPWADRQESLSNTAFDAVLEKGVRFTSVPGTRYEYSNLGYALLGRVIEVVGGMPYPEFMAKNLFSPLGMTETGLDPAKVPSAQMGTGFRKTDAGWEALPFSGPGAFSAIGGIVTTARDLARWAGWLRAAFQPDSDDNAVLSAASRREMQRIHCPITPLDTETFVLKGYGYGLVIEHHAKHGPIASHSGGYPGFSSHMRWSLETGLGAIALENATYSGAWDSASAALERVLEVNCNYRETNSGPPVAVLRLAEGLKLLLLDGWCNTTANEIFLHNVALDKPYHERAIEFAAIRQRAGGIDPSNVTVVPRDPGGYDNGYGRFQIRFVGDNGGISIEVECGPPQPMKIQSVSIAFNPSMK